MTPCPSARRAALPALGTKRTPSRGEKSQARLHHFDRNSEASREINGALRDELPLGNGLRVGGEVDEPFENFERHEELRREDVRVALGGRLRILRAGDVDEALPRDVDLPAQRVLYPVPGEMREDDSAVLAARFV